MSKRVDLIREGSVPETIWLLEHPSLYSAGRSARPDDLLASDRFPVFWTGRGGQFTYHGPGQRIVYVMLDLRKRDMDVRRFVRDLEEWVIAVLASFGIKGECREDRVGVWVRRTDLAGAEGHAIQKDKIAALGIRLRRWISWHGISINLYPDLEHYKGIVPCGIRSHGVTSLRQLGIDINFDDFDHALQECFYSVLGDRSR